MYVCIYLCMDVCKYIYIYIHEIKQQYNLPNAIVQLRDTCCYNTAVRTSTCRIGGHIRGENRDNHDNSNQQACHREEISE